MRLTLEERKKLVPLRKLAKYGLYDVLYLSLLVQRSKLKAVRIGRNYYSMPEWFHEYLEMHAHEEKASLYKEKELAEKEEKELERIQSVRKLAKIEYSAKLKGFLLRAAVVSTAVFVLVILINQFVITNDIGQVAGDTEAASSSEVILK